MKKSKYIAIIAAALMAGSCTLMQEPEGEGVDPTEVTVDLELALNLTLPDSEKAYDDIIPEVGTDFARRFVVEVTSPDGIVAQRQEFIEDIVEGKTAYTLATRFRLNAKQYKVLVWSDYVKAATPDENLYYNPASLTPVMPQGNYVGNNDRKDCFRACADLDLREYADGWAETRNLDVTLTRPVGRYEIVTTDLGAFRTRLQQGLIKGTDFTVRVRYADYRATGYNVLANVPKNFLSYLFYNVTLKTEAWSGEEASMRLAFDYCLVEPAGTQIPLEIEVLNGQGEQVSRSLLTIPVSQGYNTVVSGRFMTGTEDGSVGIDPGYDGERNIEVELI